MSASRLDRTPKGIDPDGPIDPKSSGDYNLCKHSPSIHCLQIATLRHKRDYILPRG